MRVGLLADTHDRIPVIAELVRQMQERGVQLLLHAGDWCAPFSLEPILAAQMALVGVFGRNDGDHDGLAVAAAGGFGVELFDAPHSVEVAGTRILLAHDILEVAPRSLESHDVVVHGCTHRQEMKTRGDTLIVNPGEACGWMFGAPTAAVLDLATRQVEFLTLRGPEWER